MQYLYISSNSNPLGSKDALDAADDGGGPVHQEVRLKK
jgi:hypothetical protein